MDIIRKDVPNIINEYSDGVFVTILDKDSRREKTWDQVSTGNFIIGHTLVANVINELKYDTVPQVLYDTGRLSVKKTKAFHEYLNYKCNKFRIQEKFGELPTFINIDSSSEPCIWAADILAGAYYHYYVKNDDCYSRILKKKIGIGLRKYWDY